MTIADLKKKPNTNEDKKQKKAFDQFEELLEGEGQYDN